jgi:TRL-like protein family
MRRAVPPLLGLALAAAGCQGVASPVAGALYTDVKGPLHAGERVGQKEGRACARSLLGLFATGDASIQSAAEAGGISKIDSVDHHSSWTLVAGSFCTIVRGS